MTTGLGRSCSFSCVYFRGRVSVCEFASFLFGFEGRLWDLIVLFPDHCLSFYLCLCYLNTLRRGLVCVTANA